MKHKHAHWIKIWADGEHVQWRNFTSYPWSDMIDSSSWDRFPETTQFRIKPKPEIRYYEAVVHTDDVITFHRCKESQSNFSVTFVDNKVINVEYTK